MPTTSHTTTEVQAQALATAARDRELHRLRTAARLASLKAKRKPLLVFRQGSAKNAFEVLFEWPGVLSVYDSTGRLLAQSVPGDPFALGGWHGPGGWHGAPAVGYSSHGDSQS